LAPNRETGIPPIAQQGVDVAILLHQHKQDRAEAAETAWPISLLIKEGL
jgi:hypothetical protein